MCNNFLKHWSEFEASENGDDEDKMMSCALLIVDGISERRRGRRTLGLVVMIVSLGITRYILRIASPLPPIETQRRIDHNGGVVASFQLLSCIHYDSTIIPNTWKHRIHRRITDSNRATKPFTSLEPAIAMQLPLIPLSKDSILLPGVTLRIPLSDRPDVPLLLSSLFNKATPRRTESGAILVGCVPLASPYLSKDGRNLIDGSGESRNKLNLDIRPAKASREDLFGYGTLARIVGVQGRADSEPYLFVEGQRRFKIDQVTKEKPFFEAEVTASSDDGKQSTLRFCWDLVLIK